MKTCPFCAEQIQDAAVVCRHCNRDLPSTAIAAAAAGDDDDADDAAQPSALRRFFDLMFYGWINPMIVCRQCQTAGQMRTMKGGPKHGFCCRCRTRSTF